MKADQDFMSFLADMPEDDKEELFKTVSRTDFIDQLDHMYNLWQLVQQEYNAPEWAHYR